MDIPSIINASRRLLIESIAVLDHSKTGWWKFALIVIVVAGCACAIAFTVKPSLPTTPTTPIQHDSGCHLQGDTIICE